MDALLSPASILSESRFEEMLAWLHRNRWQAVTAGEVTRAVEDPAELPEKAVLVTFDGGCRTVLQRGLPRLRKYRAPGVVFVATELVGREATFDSLDDPVQVCTWDELVQLDRSDVSVQSSGLGRRRFSRLDATEQEAEVLASRDAIDRHVGRPAEIFAYPKGDPGRGPQIVRLAGYRAACTLEGGVNALPGADPFRLARIEVGPGTDLATALG